MTAQFNKNVLHVLNRDLGAEFDPETFRHRVLWDETNERIEMRLESTLAQRVQVLGLDVTFDRGEQMRTEISTKFRRAGITEELASAGLRVTHWWTDPAGDFALSLSVPV